MHSSLLIEIGVEDLPAVPFLKELKNIKNKWEIILKENELSTKFEFFYTPRRLVLWHKKVLIKQKNKVCELFGPPINIAFENETPTKAGLSFAKKCGVDIKDLSKNEKSNKEVLYYKKEEEGKYTKDLVENMIKNFLKTLNFGKSMRWDYNKESFIRPISWLNIILGEKIVDINLFNISSSNLSYGHRFYKKAIKVVNPETYFKNLKNSFVVLDQNLRKDIILDGFKKIEESFNIKILKDESLLDEIVAITEYPTVLKGDFKESFLKLPEEIIISSMKEHQKYFPVYKDGKLINNFIFISNIIGKNFSKVIKGNEKVLKARLNDGLFFYKNDMKNKLNLDGLHKIGFMEGIGTILDKQEREKFIARKLIKKFELSNIKEDLLLRAIDLSKRDLLSEVVYEFTELQGTMGYYYAKAMGEEELIYTAIKEQYLPLGDKSPLPSNIFSAIIALSYKIDLLLSLFSINKIPSGSKDPYALRRACFGIIKIAIKYKININIEDIFKDLKSKYKTFDITNLENFFIDRLYKFYDINPSIINSVLASGDRRLLNLDEKIQTLNKISKKDNFREIFSTFKRLSNIISDVNEKISLNTELLKEKEEINLFKEYKSIINKNYDNYEEKLNALFNLKTYIDEFFDKVKVNVEDINISKNRKTLVFNIYKSLKDIADIKEISI